MKTRMKFPAATTALLAAAAVLGFGRNSPGQDAPAAATPVFAEDFESGAINPAVWTMRVNGAASVKVQSEVAAHGKSALLVAYPARVRAYGFIVANHLPDSLQQHFFGRAYVLFPKAPPNAHDVFITAGSAGWPVSNFLEIGLRQNKAQLSYQQNAAPPSPRGETMIAGPAYPVGKWFCLEWEFNDSPDHMTIWIDGKQVLDKDVAFKGTSDHLVKSFTDFGFGFRSWGNVPNGFNVYYDDIAFGTARIGAIDGPTNEYTAPVAAPATTMPAR